MPLDAPGGACYIAPVFRRSSAVEQLTVNQLVVGSIPTAGAKKALKVKALRAFLFLSESRSHLRVTLGVTNRAPIGPSEPVLGFFRWTHTRKS